MSENLAPVAAPNNFVQFEVNSSGVAYVTMNRPEVFNAFDESMITQLSDLFDNIEVNPAIRLVVLSGSGKHFSAGADLSWMQRASAASQEWNLADARRFSNMLAKIADCSKPTIAKVQGAALGGGVGLACACDMAVATDDASFSVSEAKFGILPAVIGPYVIQAVGKRQAKRLALTASRINAQEALAMGLVQKVVSREALDACVAEMVKDLLICGPQAQKEIKQLFAQIPVGMVSPEVRELTAQTISRVRTTDEAKAGFAAFFAKQAAPWIQS